MSEPDTLVGRRFGLWTVVAFDGLKQMGPCKRWNRTWRCVCDCGTERELSGSQLTSRKSRSCGCARQSAVTKHGNCRRLEPRSAEYRKWGYMMQRCYNPNSGRYPRYGGRGIEVHEDWHVASNFLEYVCRELGECPAGMSLDRIDNDGNYAPGNIRWATAAEQAANRSKRHTKRVKNGKINSAQTKTARTRRSKNS